MISIKLKELYDLYYDDKDKNFRYTYEKWLRDGVPSNKPSKMGKVMSFFHDNFGLNYGDNERFQEIEKEFTKYLLSDSILRNTIISTLNFKKLLFYTFFYYG